MNYNSETTHINSAGVEFKYTNGTWCTLVGAVWKLCLNDIEQTMKLTKIERGEKVGNAYQKETTHIYPDGTLIKEYRKLDGRWDLWEYWDVRGCRWYKSTNAPDWHSKNLVALTNETTTAADLLKDGLEILEQRGKEYETDTEQERSFPQVAIAFNAITGHQLKGSEVALIQQILKDVRQWSQDRLHADSVIDGINYAALKGEELYKEYSDDN